MVQETKPNRATRRHPAALPPPQPDIPAQDDAQGDRLRVFGSNVGDEVTLGDGDVYHVARLTAAGVADIQNLLMAGMPAVEGDTIGEQLVGGMLATQNYGAMHDFLVKAIEEDVPARVERESTPDELITVVDTFFQQSGLRWLERMVKNLTSRAAEKMEAQIATLVDTVVDETLKTGKVPSLPWQNGTEPPLPLSTTSS